jgi:predicted  nucleic acid-binding Zn-ribbon protein
MNHNDMQFVLTYDTIRRFDDRLKNIERAVMKDADNEVELTQLRAENAQLKAEIESARSNLKESTDNLAGAVAANTPPPTGQ